MAEDATKFPGASDLLEDLLGESAGTETSPHIGGAVEFRLRPSHDQVAVLLDCPDPLASLDSWVSRIYLGLQQMDLPEYPNPTAIKALLTHCCTPGQDLLGHTLIMGQAPILSVDARLAWSREYFAEGWIVDEKTGRIDYREKVENCSVVRNELLLRLHHAVDGQPGQDIFGTKIPVEKAEKLRVRCGKGVSELDEGPSTAYYADLDGRVRFADNAVTVDEVYQVNGNVGLATGNIHHTGSVTINGDVLADTIIEAQGDVVVKGLVEGATIVCGGTLTVAGGILGGEGHKIRAGCNVEAKYIRSADVAAPGDILVAKEIAHSRVRCLGSVLVPSGRIAGGTTIALRGIRVGTAGAPGATDTVLMAGVDYSLQAQIDLYHEKIARLEATLKPVENALRNAGAADRDLSEGIQQVVESMAFKRMNIKNAISRQYQRVEKLMSVSKEEAGFHVVMYKEVWSGTTIWLGDGKTRVKSSILKPRIALLREDRVRVLPLGDDNLPPEPNHPRCPQKLR